MLLSQCFLLLLKSFILLDVPLLEQQPVLVYLRPRFIREREQQRSMRRRLQRLTDRETSYTSNSHQAENWRHLGHGGNAVVGYIRAVSSAVQEGCLSDEEGGLSDAETPESAAERQKDCSDPLENHQIDHEVAGDDFETSSSS